MDSSVFVSPEEIENAKRLQEIAERAERRALDRIQSNVSSSKRPFDEINGNSSQKKDTNGNNNKDDNSDVKFLSKKQREELALKRLQEQREFHEKKTKDAEMAHENFITGRNLLDREKQLLEVKRQEQIERQRRESEEKMDSKEFVHEVRLP